MDLDLDPTESMPVNPSFTDNFREEKVFIEPFPLTTAGIITSASAASGHYAHYAQSIHGSEENPYKPFSSRMEWEMARWAKLNDIGSTTLSKLLSINGVSQNYIFYV